MPNIVLYDGDQYFVVDIYYYDKHGIKYKLDDGHWVDSSVIEIVD